MALAMEKGIIWLLLLLLRVAATHESSEKQSLPVSPRSCSCESKRRSSAAANSSTSSSERYNSDSFCFLLLCQ